MMAWKSEELKSLNQSIKHKIFIGCEQKPWNGHGTDWDTIDVNDRSIIKILKEIHPKANGLVWKGFTGPEDSYNDYRLYAKIVNKSSSEFEGQYMITDVKPFSIPNNPNYSDGYGVEITLSCLAHAATGLQ